MQPNHCDLLGQVQNESRTPARMTREEHQPLRENALQSASLSGAAPVRSEDSWIEVASQPSSSSMSSINDDIITTGLRVEQQTQANSDRGPGRRVHRRAASTPVQLGYPSRESGSSQDEYEESESESDHVLSSSNEDMSRQPLGIPLPSAPDAAFSSDEDDSSTALGTRISSSRFVPQPNVFSHPPVSQNPSWTRATDTRRAEPSEVSNSSRRTTIRNSQASMRSSRSTRRQQHTPYNMISPSHQADNDAALRASLSTLLSCAAAARGLQKPEPQQAPAGPSRQPPSSFRLVPESVAMGEEGSAGEAPPAAETDPSAGSQPRKHSYSAPSYATQAAHASKKRRSSFPKDHSGHPSASKKSRRGTIIDPTSANNPTIMTWVLSAGVVVLFSAISFSAGYMLGREVGRMEMGSAVGDGGVTGGAPSGACGQKAVKGGLKRMRWGSSGAGSGILA